MTEQKFIIEAITDPVKNARFGVQHEQFKKNSEWLSSHWPEVLPEAFGRFVAVSGQQAFLADNAQEARRLAIDAHPEDQGVFVKYVSPFKGIRLYGSLRRVEG